MDDVECGHLDAGGTLEDVVLCLFDGDAYDGWPLPFSFKDHSVVDFNLVPFDCDGFMTEYGFSMNDMIRDDGLWRNFGLGVL